MTAAIALYIEAVHSSALYQERVYTQNATVSLDEGPSFDIYDHRCRLSAAMEGTTQSLELLVLLCEIALMESTEKAIQFDREQRPVFRGQVVDLEQTNEQDRAVLDVGTGSIIFDLRETAESIETVEYLQLTRPVIHLEGVED